MTLLFAGAVALLILLRALNAYPMRP